MQAVAIFFGRAILAPMSSRPEPRPDSTARIAAIGVAIVVGALFVWPVARMLF